MSINHSFEAWMLNKIAGVSYVGKPQNNTMMYLTKKIETKLALLKDTKDCLIFLEDNIEVPREISEQNYVVLVKDPAKAYTEVALDLFKQISFKNSKRPIKLAEGGYYIGENVQIGVNVIIEPGAYIDHDVILMDGVYIKTGAKIRYGSIIGSGSIICENAVIGDPAFNTSRFEDGSLQMIPSFGKVYIGNNVYVGANSTISRGGADNTIISDDVKIDANVRIGHDVQLSRCVEVISGSIVGGYSSVDENTVLSLNSTIKNRISIGKNAFVGMGSIVSNNVQDNTTVSCLPAETLKQIAKRRLLDIKIEKYLNEK